MHSIFPPNETLGKFLIDWNSIRKIRVIRGESTLNSGSYIGFRLSLAWQETAPGSMPGPPWRGHSARRRSSSSFLYRLNEPYWASRLLGQESAKEVQPRSPPGTRDERHPTQPGRPRAVNMLEASHPGVFVAGAPRPRANGLHPCGMNLEIGCWTFSPQRREEFNIQHPTPGSMIK